MNRPLALLAFVPLLLVACDAGLTESATTAEGEAFDAKESRFEICHFSAGDETYYYIEVNGNALETHLDHGDAYFSEEPGEGERFCEPEQVDCPCFDAETLDGQDYDYICQEGVFTSIYKVGPLSSATACYSAYCNGNLCERYQEGELIVQIKPITDAQTQACVDLILAEAIEEGLEPFCSD